MSEQLIQFMYRGQTMPDELRKSLDLYAQHKVKTGSFLQAVLENDLLSAVATADNDNITLLPVIAVYVHNELPSRCHGSREAVRQHLTGANKR